MSLAFNFRASVDWNEQYSTFVARCLETGSVASADSAVIAREMMTELLSDEALYATKHNNLRNLFSCPAPISAWENYEIQGAIADELVKLLDGKVTVSVHFRGIAGGRPDIPAAQTDGGVAKE